MTLELLLQARLDALLECQPATDKGLALSALVEGAEQFGEDALLELVADGGTPALFVLTKLSQGALREEVFAQMLPHIGGSTAN